MLDIGKAKRSPLTNFDYFGFIDGKPICVYVEKIKGEYRLLFKTPKDKNELQLILKAVGDPDGAYDFNKYEEEVKIQKGEPIRASTVDIKSERKSLKNPNQERLFDG